MKDVEALKKIAGVSACDSCKDGMIIGLGTGSTVRYTILEIGRKIREENSTSLAFLPAKKQGN